MRLLPDASPHAVFFAILDEHLDQLREPAFYEDYEKLVAEWERLYNEAVGREAAKFVKVLRRD